ncbi:hypothetical protein HPB48_003832 [Haemaphysalis longicornis]|uniref:Uncharacterized protein n=1 Tax=Haemaphysalis longicornis TaxID=44386 RepID=A0A9J6F6S1_HAELO|nr:hypothetical protein HPB48_003832 [Haemaphysalis longicornis]
MVKAACWEVTATFVRNCFHKAGFVDTQPEAEPDASDGHESSTPTWGAMTSARTISFVPMKMLTTAEPCRDEGTVDEVRGKSDAEESDADADETSEPAPISAPVSIGYIMTLNNLFTTRASAKSTRLL